MSVIKKLRKGFFNIWINIPFGDLLKFKDGAQTIVLKKDLWVIISDGKSSDTMPLNFCSQEFVDDVEQRLVNTYGLEN